MAQVRFKDLSVVNKLGIAGGLVALLAYIIQFFIGFIEGVKGGLV